MERDTKRSPKTLDIIDRVDITDTEDFLKYTATSPDSILGVLCTPVHLGQSHNTHKKQLLGWLSPKKRTAIVTGQALG